jgi:hypothetical protein
VAGRGRVQHDRHGHVVVGPGPVSDREQAVVAGLHGPHHSVVEAPLPVDDLADVLDLVVRRQRGPVDRDGQRPLRAGPVVDVEHHAGAVAQAVARRYHQRIRTALEVGDVEVDVEVPGADQASPVGSDAERDRGPRVERVLEIRDAVGVGDVAEHVDPGLGLSELAEGLGLSVPDGDLGALGVEDDLEVAGLRALAQRVRAADPVVVGLAQDETRKLDRVEGEAAGIAHRAQLVSGARPVVHRPEARLVREPGDHESRGVRADLGILNQRRERVRVGADVFVDDR